MPYVHVEAANQQLTPRFDAPSLLSPQIEADKYRVLAAARDDAHYRHEEAVRRLREAHAQNIEVRQGEGEGGRGQGQKHRGGGLIHREHRPVSEVWRMRTTGANSLSLMSSVDIPSRISSPLLPVPCPATPLQELQANHASEVAALRHELAAAAEARGEQDRFFNEYVKQVGGGQGGGGRGVNGDAGV